MYGITALTDATAFDVSTITSQLSSGALSALNGAVSGLAPVLVAIIGLRLAVSLFKRFAS